MMRNTNKVTFLAFATSHPIMAFMVVNTICKTVVAVPKILNQTMELFKDIQSKSKELVEDGTFKKVCDEMFASARENGVNITLAPTNCKDNETDTDTDTETENEETTEAPTSEEEGESLLS